MISEVTSKNIKKEKKISYIASYFMSSVEYLFNKLRDISQDLSSISLRYSGVKRRERKLNLHQNERCLFLPSTINRKTQDRFFLNLPDITIEFLGYEIPNEEIRLMIS